MKKTLTSLILSVSLLTACNNNNSVEVIPVGDNRFNGLNGEISIITDKETGCNYIHVIDGVGDHRTASLTTLMKNSTMADCGL